MADICDDADAGRTRSLPLEYYVSLLKRGYRGVPWQAVPLDVRQAFRQRVLRALVPKAKNAAPGTIVSIAGLLSHPCGQGEGARLTLKALTLLGYRPHLIDITRPSLPDEAMNGRIAPPLERGPGTMIFHFNPDILMRTLAMVGRLHLSGKRIIGYWAWELPAMPDAWRPMLDYVDEIWVPSRFVAEAITPFTAKPVRVVAHPVAISPPGKRRRADFQIADNGFAVLSMFSMASSFERKNPLAAVAAFKAAFGARDDASLILKVADGARFPENMRRLRQAIGAARNIRILESDLDGQSTRDLIASADVVLSLHRSEGFGLVMAEAMHAQTAVIATQWSGNLDFMNAQTAALVSADMIAAADADGIYGATGQLWADPSITEAAQQLRFLADHADAAAAMRMRAWKAVNDRLGLAAFEKSIAGALEPKPAIALYG